MCHPFRGNVSLEECRKAFMAQALSISTQRVYASGSRQFLTFTTMHNLPKLAPQTNLPICNPHILEYFVCHCASHLKISYTTIKSYLAGVRNMYILEGFPNPLHGSTGELCARLELLMRGIKKSCSVKKNTRQPITGAILQAVCKQLNRGLFGNYVDSLMKTACLLAFFGFLRCGEFTCKYGKFDPQVDITFQDVVTYHDHVSITIKASKTDPFRLGCVIPIYANGTMLCPVQAVGIFIKLRKKFPCSAHDPFFMLPDGKALSRRAFLKLFGQICRAAHIDTASLTGHSFRIGAATTAAESQTPDYLVQTLGRWKSQSYLRYTRISQSLIRQTQNLLAAKALQS